MHRPQRAALSSGLWSWRLRQISVRLHSPEAAWLSRDERKGCQLQLCHGENPTVWMCLCPPSHHCPHTTPAKPQASLRDHSCTAPEEFQTCRPRDSLGMRWGPQLASRSRQSRGCSPPTRAIVPCPGTRGRVPVVDQATGRQLAESQPLWMPFGKQNE